jgi:signal transduction histidine kinase
LVKFFFKTNYLSIIIGLVSVAVLYFISLHSYILYHSLIEVFTIVISFTIFIITWNSKKFIDNNYLLFVGIAFFFISILDLLHTLSYSGMGIFINFTGPNLATQLWIATRYFESISLFLAIIFIKKRLNYKIQLICYFIATILVLLTIFYWKIFPVCYLEGSGLTIFKIFSEYIISVILAASIFFLYLHRKIFNRKIFLLIIISIFVSILAELSFTLYVDVYGLLNQLGHFFELVSFFLIYKAIIETGFSQPIELLFFELKQSEIALESLSRFPSENPNPVMRFNSDNSIIYANEPAEILLQQLSNENKGKLLKLMHDPVSGLVKNKNNKLKIIEFKVDKLIYEFIYVPIKGFDYFNIYGRNITARKEAERSRDKIIKEKALIEERNKMAREFHDTVTQTLFSANLIAEVIPKLWRKEPETAIESLEEVKHLNNVALMEMRAILYELRPSALKDEDLGDLLLILSKSFEARSKIKIKLTVSGDYKFPHKIELGYFRIAQEALNNIVKHSHATRADMVLEILPEKLYMDITDNGRGIDDKKITSTSLGLTIMKERAKLMGASISIGNLNGKGTRITVIYKKKSIKKEES